MGPFKDIGVEKSGHVALVEIRRPPNNFFDVAADQGNRHGLRGARRRRRLPRAGAGGARKGVLRRRQFRRRRAFSTAGRRPRRTRPPASAPLYVEGNRLFRTKKPIVAAVHGAAVGGGFGLAMVADFRVTCAEARFCANFTRLGFHPGFGLTVTLPAVIGPTKAALMFYTSRRVRGDEAHAMGLADALVPQDEVRAAALVARRRDRRELAARADRDTRHHARQSCRPRPRGDRSRARRADAPAPDRRLQGRREGDGGAAGAGVHEPIAGCACCPAGPAMTPSIQAASASSTSLRTCESFRPVRAGTWKE